MRFFAQCSFLGTHFVGWQKQPNGTSVQGVIEERISTFLRTPVEIIGCGRTDAGVHASQYIFHFDVPESLPSDFRYRINQMLPMDIALQQIREVAEDAHARFSAIERSYQYHVHFEKDPFVQLTSLYYARGGKLDWERMQKAGEVLMGFQEFKPFCKSGSDTPHYLCDLRKANWLLDGESAVFTVTANRFLRGMVRLMVGTMLQVGNGSLGLDALRETMHEQRPLKQAESVPAHGLHLVDVRYP